jgi:hypothetical protein
MTVPLEALLGPFGLTAALLVAVGWVTRQLFKSYDREIADLKGERDRMLAGWQASTAAVDRLADAVEVLTRPAAPARRPR